MRLQKLKTIITCWLFVYGCCPSFAQLEGKYEWSTLEAHNFSPLYIKHIFNNGDILAEREVPFGYVISKDEGKTWQEFFYGSLGIRRNGFNYHMPFREDANGDIYFKTYKEIVKLKGGNLEIIYESSRNIEDFEFLPNGNIALANTYYLKILDKDGKELHSLNTFHGSTKIMPGEFGFHYLVDDRNSLKLRKFNDDLSFFNEEEFYFGGTTNVMSDGRIFSDFNYTEDQGMTWTKIESELFNKYHASLVNVYNENVLALHEDKLFLSKDLGVSFEELSEGILVTDNGWTYSTIMKENTIIILGNDCYNTLTKISHDLGKTWTINKSSVGHSHAMNAAIDFNSNILLQSCEESYFSTENASGNWTDHPDESALFTIYPLPDNTFLKTSETGISKSYDAGQTWIPKFTTLWYDLRIKENLIVGYNKEGSRATHVMISRDNGETWIEKEVNTSFYFNNSYRFDISKTEKMVSWGTSNTSNLTSTVRIFDFELWENYESYELPEQEGYMEGLVCSFNNPNFYVLLQNSLPSDEHSLFFSPDMGATFVKRPIPFRIPYLSNPSRPFFEIDRHENLYIGFLDQLYMSVDQGVSWINISLNFPAELQSITDVSIGFDDHIYVSNFGRGLLRSDFKVDKQIEVESLPVLKVNVFEDQNKNCTFQNFEPGFQNVRVMHNAQTIKPTNSFGNVFFFPKNGEQEIEIIYDEFFFGSCEESYTIMHDGTEQVQELQIPFQIINECIHLESSIGTTFLRRCFESHLSARICNQGTVTTGREDFFIELDPYFHLISTSIPYVSFEENNLHFETKELDAGECMSIHLKVEVSCEAELGQMHCTKIYTDYENDCYEDIVFQRDEEFCLENIGAYDPNDKNIIVNSVLGATYLQEGDELEYLIRFQNTGTDTAFTVRIVDDLSSKFDYTTVQPLVASHDYEWFLEGGQLEILFEDILLVDSFTNEPASHGFVKFKVELKDEVEMGENFENEAAIYFDFNDPIITNEVVANFDNDMDGDGYYSTNDCNDQDPSINPGMTESCDGMDNDCDEEIDEDLPMNTFYEDLDNDGYGNESEAYEACESEMDGFVNVAGDCDDSDPNINPDTPEEPYNGIDDDCEPETLDDDLDGDGFVLAEDCDDQNADINPDAPEEPYNGIDDDCDPETLDDDLDGDGFVLADDCDDENVNVYPGAMEIPNNGIDEDCDGMDMVTSSHSFEDAGIKIYPNPVKDDLSIKLNRPFNFSVRVISANGQVILKDNNSARIDFRSIQPGIYFIQILDQDSGKRYVEMISKM